MQSVVSDVSTDGDHESSVIYNKLYVRVVPLQQ